MFIGIDIGTSSVKATLADKRGNVIGAASRSYPCSHPRPGWSEQNPEDWYGAAVSAVREVVVQSGSGLVAVEGISFAGQMHGLVVLDKDDRVIRPAVLWNDGRSVEECSYLNETIGKQRLIDHCGNIAFPGFTAPKLLWMRAHEPGLFERIDKLMLPKDYLVYRMTGMFCTDVSDASGTLLFDVRNRVWSRFMVDLVGIDVQQLPSVHESWEVVGELSASAAMDCGLPQGVRVSIGAGDNAASAVGMGCVREGQCNISLGTSGTVFIPSQTMPELVGDGLHAFADATGSYHFLGCILSAASANGWWIRNTLASGFPQEIGKIVPSSLGRNRTFFLPYLMGERSPINDAGARAAFVGMDMDTTRTDMVQAVIEGVTFALRQSFNVAVDAGVCVDDLALCGGGAQNDIWCQIVADVFNMPVRVLDSSGGPGYGACLLSMVGCGLYPNVKVAAQSCAPGPTKLVAPDASAAMRYDERYRAFESLYPALRHVFPLVGGAVND